MAERAHGGQDERVRSTADRQASAVDRWLDAPMARTTHRCWVLVRALAWAGLTIGGVVCRMTLGTAVGWISGSVAILGFAGIVVVPIYRRRLTRSALPGA